MATMECFTRVCLQFLVPVFKERAEEKTSASLTKTSVKLSVSICLNVASCFRTLEL